MDLAAGPFSRRHGQAMTGPIASNDLAPRLAALWQLVAHRMADLPIYNPKLAVQTTEFRRHGPWSVGIVVTPWFMNVVAVPDDPTLLPPSVATLTLALPAGEIEAIAADLDGFGRLAAASLFSPMDAFDDPAVTAATAQAALAALFQPTDEPPHAPPLDRRRLFLDSAAARGKG
jgi:[NiFe] hydrogenase assembly HybE family chaperone